MVTLSVEKGSGNRLDCGFYYIHSCFIFLPGLSINAVMSFFVVTPNWILEASSLLKPLSVRLLSICPSKW